MFRSFVLYCCLTAHRSTQVTAYVGTYVAAHEESNGTSSAAAGLHARAATALLVLWTAVTAGRFLGLVDQFRLARARDPAPVAAHLAAWTALGTAGAALVLASRGRHGPFLAGVALYGLGNGPTVAYAYDLNNRLTTASEANTSAVMVGLNLGASAVPYALAALWRGSLGPAALGTVAVATMVAPMVGLAVLVRCRGLLGKSASRILL